MRTRYSFTSAVGTPREFLDRLLAGPRTLVTDDPIHYPPDYDILVNVDDGEQRIRVRHYASPQGVASPILQLDLRPQPSGLVIECIVLNRHEPFSHEERDTRDGPSEEIVSSATEPGEAIFVVVLAVLWRVCAWLWNTFVWNLWLDALLQRRAMAKFGTPLLNAIKDATNADAPIEGATTTATT